MPRSGLTIVSGVLRVLVAGGAPGAFGLLSLLVALIIAPFGIHEVVTDHSFRSHAVQTTGIVTDEHRAGDRDARTLVTVEFMVGQRLYDFAGSLSTGQKILGSSQPVLYDPAKPSHAELADDDLSDKTEAAKISILFVVIGIVLFLIGVIYTQVRRPRTSLLPARIPATTPFSAATTPATPTGTTAPTGQAAAAPLPLPLITSWRPAEVDWADARRRATRYPDVVFVLLIFVAGLAVAGGAGASALIVLVPGLPVLGVCLWVRRLPQRATNRVRVAAETGRYSPVRVTGVRMADGRSGRMLIDLVRYDGRPVSVRTPIRRDRHIPDIATGREFLFVAGAGFGALVTPASPGDSWWLQGPIPV